MSDVNEPQDHSKVSALVYAGPLDGSEITYIIQRGKGRKLEINKFPTNPWVWVAMGGLGVCQVIELFLR